MKAAEYFTTYFATADNIDTYCKAVGLTLIDLLKETKELAKTRKAKFDSAYIAIIAEQVNKIAAINRLIRNKSPFLKLEMNRLGVDFSFDPYGIDAASYMENLTRKLTETEREYVYTAVRKIVNF